MRKMFHAIDDWCRGAAAHIIVAPMRPFDNGKIQIPTEQAFLWFIMIVCLPVTLVLSLPFWLVSFAAHRLAGPQPDEADIG
jgi:hypothetical protein